jgi:hypothetical protein
MAKASGHILCWVPLALVGARSEPPVVPSGPLGLSPGFPDVPSGPAGVSCIPRALRSLRGPILPPACPPVPLGSLGPYSSIAIV